MNKKVLISRIFIGIGVAATLAAAAAGILLLLGRLQVSLKEPGQEVAVVGKTICDEDIIKDYQAVISGSQGYGATSLNPVVGKIKNKGGPANDATCHFIMLHDASLKNDRQNMDKLKETFVRSLKSRQVVESFYKLGINEQNVNVLVEIGKSEATGSGDGSPGEG